MGWAAPLTSEYQERSVQRRGVCTESGCRAQIALQRNTRGPGRGKSGSPRRAPGRLRVRVAGRRAPPSPAGNAPLHGRGVEGRGQYPESRLPGWRCSRGAPTGTGRREEARGARARARAGSPRAATAGGGGAASRRGDPGEMGSGLVRRAHPLRLELRLRGRRRQQRRRQQRQRLLDGSSIFAAAPPAPLAAATNNNIRRRHSRHVTRPGAKNRPRPPPPPRSFPARPSFSHHQLLPSLSALPAGRGQQRHRDSFLKGRHSSKGRAGEGVEGQRSEPREEWWKERCWGPGPAAGSWPLGRSTFLPALPLLPF